MIEIKCPHCGSKVFACYDTEFNIQKGVCLEFCYCMDCNMDFKIKYEAVEIKSE